jgi:methyl-accepting chemotaxis protein
MDKVTQQTAASSEESSSAAEELSAQAQMVKEMVEELVALVGGSGKGRPSTLADASRSTANSVRNASWRKPLNKSEIASMGTEMAHAVSTDDGRTLTAAVSDREFSQF